MILQALLRRMYGELQEPQSVTISTVKFVSYRFFFFQSLQLQSYVIIFAYFSSYSILALPLGIQLFFFNKLTKSSPLSGWCGPSLRWGIHCLDRHLSWSMFITSLSSFFLPQLFSLRWQFLYFQLCRLPATDQAPVCFPAKEVVLQNKTNITFSFIITGINIDQTLMFFVLM